MPAEIIDPPVCILSVLGTLKIRVARESLEMVPTFPSIECVKLMTIKFEVIFKFYF